MHPDRSSHSRPGTALPSRRFRALSAFATLPLLVGILGAGPAFAVGGPVGPAVLGLAWSTSPATPCDEREVQLLFTTCECAVELVEAGREGGDPVVVRLRVVPDRVCATCDPDTHRVELGRLAPGINPIQVRVEIDYESLPDTTWPSSPVLDFIPLPVGLGCVVGVTHLQQVVIEQGATCADCPTPVCAGDSIDVTLRGMFATSCTRLLGVTLEPNPAASPLPLPPIVRVTYRDRENCAVCGQAAVPWSAHVRLPGQPDLAGTPVPLTVEAWTRDDCLADSAAEFGGRADFPIVVVDTCVAAGERVTLSAARPNPFAAMTTFTLTLSTPGGVDIGVFDVAGRRVATLLREQATAGIHAVSWNGEVQGGRRAPAGVYFVRVHTQGGGATSRKVLLVTAGAP
jgi:hypothetical protein